MKPPTFEEIDVKRLRFPIAKLTSSSTNEVDKLIGELEALMQRMNLTDDELWRAIAENTNAMSRLGHQQLLDAYQRQYQDCTAELRRRYP